MIDNGIPCRCRLPDGKSQKTTDKYRKKRMEGKARVGRGPSFLYVDNSLWLSRRLAEKSKFLVVQTRPIPPCGRPGYAYLARASELVPTCGPIDKSSTRVAVSFSVPRVAERVSDVNHGPPILFVGCSQSLFQLPFWRCCKRIWQREMVCRGEKLEIIEIPSNYNRYR